MLKRIFQSLHSVAFLGGLSVEGGSNLLETVHPFQPKRNKGISWKELYSKNKLNRTWFIIAKLNN